MTGDATVGRCVLCGEGSERVPLIRVEFRGGTWWICTQHLPVLIHDPQQLVGRMPGAESLGPSETQD